MILSTVPFNLQCESSIFQGALSDCEILHGQELPSQKVTPEPRLYGQLAQCCLRDRQGRRATEATGLGDWYSGVEMEDDFPFPNKENKDTVRVFRSVSWL